MIVVTLSLADATFQTTLKSTLVMVAPAGTSASPMPKPENVMTLLPAPLLGTPTVPKAPFEVYAFDPMLWSSAVGFFDAVPVVATGAAGEAVAQAPLSV